MATVEGFIQQQEGAQKDILLYLHHLFAEELGLVHKVRYKVPFYYNQSWICYLNPQKTGGIELCFLRGNELSNVQGLLDPKDRKQVYGITFHKVSDIPRQELMEIIQESLILDETVPYASKRKPKSKS